MSPVPASGAVRTVVADDHPLFRDAMVRALVDTGRYAIVGEAADGVTALRSIVTERPDLALLDLRMPELDGLGVLRRLQRSDLAVRAVLLSACPHPELIRQARAAGAAGFLAKDADRAEIVAALDVVAAGGPGVFQPATDLCPRLMDAEVRLLGLLHAGWTVHELPGISELPRSRVERYLIDAVHKLAAEDLGDAVASAVAWGLVPDG